MRRVLEALPNTTPRNVVETLERMFNLGGSRLPPEVFFETVEQSAVAISITDTKANILYANPAFRTVTGYEPREVIGCNESVLSFKATPKTAYDQMWRTLQSGQSWTGTLVNRRKDGSLYLAELTITPIVSAQGATEYFLGMHRDVTAVHQLERKVQNQKVLIESVVDAAPIALALLDEHGRVLLDNHEYKKLIGDLGAGEPALQILSALRASMGERFDLARSQANSFVGQEVRVERRGDGDPRWFSCSGHWFDEQDTSADSFFELKRKTYLLLVMNETTSVRQHQEKERIGAMRAVMAEAEMVQGLQETLAGATYQLQGPLNLIQAAVKMLDRRNGDVQDPLAEVLRQALAAGEEALQKLQASMPQGPVEAEVPVNLNEILRDVLMLLTDRLLANGITVDWNPAPVLATINGCPNILRNMFKQLLQNAIEAMNEKGRKERELRIVTHHRDDRVCVHLEDTGPGIPDALRSRVFEPFFTTKGKATRSFGIGLAMVQEGVSRHGGVVEIDPNFKRGCRIQLRFPVSRSSVD
jgi:nitrogen fixation negative regulator NifL